MNHITYLIIGVIAGALAVIGFGLYVLTTFKDEDEK